MQVSLPVAVGQLDAGAELDHEHVAVEHGQVEQRLVEGVPLDPGGALKDLEDRQKSRATRVKRDTLDQALLDLAVFYRDVLMLQLGADVELANGDREADLRQVAASSTPEATLRRLQAVMHCRERLPLNVAPLLAVEDMALSLVEG